MTPRSIPSLVYFRNFFLGNYSPKFKNIKQQKEKRNLNSHPIIQKLTINLFLFRGGGARVLGKREGERGERVNESKNVKKNPTALQAQ